MNRCAYQNPFGCTLLLGPCRLGCGRFEPVRDVQVSTNATGETLTERRPETRDVRPFAKVESVGGAPALVVGVKGTF